LRRSLDVDVWAGSLPPPYEQLVERTRGCAGLLSLLTDRVDAALLDACPELRVVSNFAVGFDNIDVAACRSRGIAVGHTPGVLTEATADLAFALLISAARLVPEAQDSVKRGEWRTWEPLGFVGCDLHGATLGIVGMGRIGAALARRCAHGWGMRVLYSDPAPNEEVERELGAERVPLSELLAESDFVSLHAPLTAETELLVDAAALQRMKSTAVLVNTARGGLVDQDALFEALSSGQLFAAGLDVTDPEPMVPEDPLLHHPRCIVTPHVASATRRTRDAMAEIAADNLVCGIEGRPLRHAVGRADA
jgi:lactate dehydrogenase-like 2-hydroxyacid dehydrogenase